jgi:sphingomyelin phosphodiesterase acid-like 3
LAASLQRGVSQLGNDSNYLLVKSCLAAAVQKCPRPAFILYLGDSLAHNWKERYERVSSRSSLSDLEPYREFTQKTIEFLALEFRKHFPEVPILAALGNEDAFCGDYEIEPSGEFLTMFADAWLGLIGPSADVQSLRSSFGRDGYYSVRIPPLDRHRVVVVNSVFFSNLYENSCGSKKENPCGEEMSWLRGVLAEASDAGERVWLMMHIPVRINDYNTVKNEEAGSGPVEFWNPVYTRQFVELMLEHRETVQAVFAGHTHMDDFRLIETKKGPLVVNKLVPSISPIFKNNPAFQVYQYDEKTGAIINYQTYYLANLSTAGRATALEDLQWLREYDFCSAYRQTGMDIRAVSSIAAGLKTDFSTQDIYMRFYSASAPPAFDKAILPAYSCAILHTTLDEFEKCQETNDGASGRLPKGRERNEQYSNE